MKKTVTVISILCVLIITAGILMLTGVIDIKGIIGGTARTATQNTEKEEITSESQSTSAKPEAAVWIRYMDTYVLIDRNGVIAGTSESEPENVMQLSGVDIVKMVIGEPVEVNDTESFEYGLLVTNKLAAVGIPDKGEVFISADKSAVLYLKNIKILLGRNEDLLEKLDALRKFYNKVSELDGTLYMQELDRNNMGYTFKVNGAETEIMETESTGEDGEADEEYEEDPGVYEEGEDEA